MKKGKKLSLEQVRSIRELIDSQKHTQKHISSLFSVSQQAISDVKNGKVWKGI